MELGSRTFYLNRQRRLPFRVQSASELKSPSCHQSSDLASITARFSFKVLALYLIEGTKELTWERVKGPILSKIFTLSGTS